MMRKTVNERICGSVNLWDPMEKVKLLNWDDLCKNVVSDVQHQAQRSRALLNKFIIIDGIAVIQAIIYTGKFRTCMDLGHAFSKRIDRYVENYMGTRVIFDNYSNATSLTSELRYASSGEDLIVDDSTPIKDKKKLLSSRKTKDALTIFLAKKVITLCKTPVVTATRKSFMTSAINRY